MFFLGEVGGGVGDNNWSFAWWQRTKLAFLILSSGLSSVSCGEISRIPRGCWELVKVPEMVVLFWIVILGSEAQGCDTSMYCHSCSMPLTMVTMENLTVPSKRCQILIPSTYEWYLRWPRVGRYDLARHLDMGMLSWAVQGYSESRHTQRKVCWRHRVGGRDWSAAARSQRMLVALNPGKKRKGLSLRPSGGTVVFVALPTLWFHPTDVQSFKPQILWKHTFWFS